MRFFLEYKMFTNRCRLFILTAFIALSIGAVHQSISQAFGPGILTSKTENRVFSIARTSRVPSGVYWNQPVLFQSVEQRSEDVSTCFGLGQDGSFYGMEGRFLVRFQGNGVRTVLHVFGESEGVYGRLLESNGYLYGVMTTLPTDRFGNLWCLKVESGEFESLHRFTGGEDGAMPLAGLAAMTDSGTLYGTTSQGGLTGLGTVFEISNQRKLRTLHHFSGLDGSFPQAELLAGGDGMLYGTTRRGGIQNQGTLFWINPQTGMLVTIRHFGGFDGAFPAGSLVTDGSGVLYGITSSGGNAGDGTVYRVSSQGDSFEVIHHFGGKSGRHPIGLVMGKDGFLYGTTFSGGKAGHGVIFRMKSDGSGYQVVYHFTEENDPRPGLITGKDGNIKLLYQAGDLGQPTWQSLEAIILGDGRSETRGGEFQPTATFSVSTQAELVTAINTANGNAEADIINITSNINLTSALPTITAGGGTVTINGGGLGLTCTGNGFRGLDIASGATVILNDLGVRDATGSQDGVGIQNAGTLTMTNCTVADNFTSGQGGGIRNSGSLTMTSCRVTGNTAGFDGGGISHVGTALSLTNCRISGNRGNLSITGNGGGGLAVVSNNTSTLIGCVISDNEESSTNGGGGGIRKINGGDLALINCTLYANRAGGSLGGGGILNQNGNLTLTNCTFSQNNAANTGTTAGGGGINRSGGTLTMTNTLLGDNHAASTTASPDLRSTATTATNCLIESASGHTITNGSNGNIVGMDAVLGALLDNGGPTQTIAIGCGSPARNTGTNTVTGAPLNLTTDQRGTPFARQVEATVDIGAYEIQIPGMPSAITGSSSVCQGATGTMYSVVNDPTAVSYTWSYSGTGASFSSTTSSVSINFSGAATSGTLSVTANGLCSTSTAQTLPITVVTAPTTPAAGSDQTLCAGPAPLWLPTTQPLALEPGQLSADQSP